MQTEVVELLSYNAVKVLVEYGHNTQVSLILKNLILSSALFLLLGFPVTFSHWCTSVPIHLPVSLSGRNT